MKRHPSTQQITWFLDLERNNQLDLNPPYQRKSVWTPKDRRFFLDTIFRNYPTPPIFIHRSLNENGIPKYHVVDGKQRLETILRFANNKIALDPSFGDVDLNGKKFSELSADNKRKFWDYTLIVDFIETIEGTNIEEVFDRVNRNSKNLQQQELRHARFNGWFISEAETENDDDFWWDVRINSASRDKRMKSVQLISELLLIILENQIVGFSQEYLDNMYAKYDQPEEPESDLEDFDEDNYKAKKSFIREYLAEMQRKNQCISNHAKTANNIYILWALLALEPQNSLPSASDLAVRYDAFIDEVNRQAEIEGHIGAGDEDHQTVSDDHLVYYKNSKGASTDFTQRQARYNALKSGILCNRT